MFFRSVPLFTILGFRVRLDLSWLLVALWLIVDTARGFTAPPQSVSPAVAVALGFVFAIGLLFSIVLHELSHSLVARRFGMHIRGITLFLLGGVAEMEEEPDKPWSEFLMAAAGPASSLVIGGACALAGLGLDAAGAGATIGAVMMQLALMNVVLAVFNCIPGFPLDGGRIFRSILWGLKGDALWATRIASFMGQAFGAIFMGIGAVLLFTMKNPGFLLWILIGLFLFRSAPMSYRVMRMRSRLKSETVARFVDTAPVVVASSMSVSALLDSIPHRGFDDVIPIVDGQRVVGFVSLGRALAVPEHERALTFVSEIAAHLPEDAIVPPGLTVEAAVRRMQQLRLPALLVSDASRMLGVVRFHDLVAFAESG